MDEIEAIKKLDSYRFRACGKNDPKFIVWLAYQKLLKLNKVNRINNLSIYLLSLQHQIKNGTPEPIRGQKQ